MIMNISVDKNKSIPIYMQIKEQLVDYITRNNLPSGSLLPNVKKVAMQAGVSTRTADQAFQELINDGLCFRRPKKGTFVAKKEELEVKKLCGLLGSYQMENMQQNILIAELYSGISEAAKKYDVDASILFGNSERSINLYETAGNFDFLGAMALEPRRVEEVVNLARRYPDKKFIILNYMIEGIDDTPDNVYAIVNDDFGGAYKIAEYYISRGCKAPAIVNYPLDYHDETYNERTRGFLQAVKDYALDFDSSQNILMPHQDSTDRNGFICSAYLEVKKFLARGKRPDIIFTVNDYLAEGIEKCIESEGLTGQIQVAGYDCLVKEFSVERRFNSVRVNYTEMGRVAMAVLNDCTRKYPKIIKVMPELDINNL
jgi:GntR family transcriptional regulator of arabinose operon